MSGRYRVLFLMQQVLGHVTHSSSVERAARADPDLDASWVPITYGRPAGLIERLPLPPGAKGVARAAVDVQRALLTHRVDGVVFNSPALATSAVGWMGLLPTMISLDVTPRQFDREGLHFGHEADAGGRWAAFKHQVNTAVFRRAALLLPWARWAARSLLDEYGVDEKRIEIVPPGVDLQLWRQAAGSPRRAGPPQVLFVGGDFRRKGGDLLVDWYRCRGRDLSRLVVVSADPEAAAARSLGVEVHTDLSPNSARLRDLYAGSDVFVMPSRSEPFGIAAVEALASGLPVVATAQGGLTDIVEDGVNGRLVRPGDGRDLACALEALLADEAGRRAMGAEGRRLAAERFDAARNGQRLLDLVKQRIDGARGREAAGGG